MWVESILILALACWYWAYRKRCSDDGSSLQIPFTKLALIAATFLWIGWLGFLGFSEGNKDPAGHPIGADFIVYYTGGHTLLAEDSSKLYDKDYQKELQQEALGYTSDYYFNLYTPPFFLYLYAPFSLLPYFSAYIVWTVFAFGLLWAGVRMLGAPSARFPLMLSFFPMFATIAYGQTSAVSFFAICLCFYLWERRLLFWSGIAASLVLFKPQLLFGVCVLWVLNIRRDFLALLGLAVGGAGLFTLCWTALPDASASYYSLVTTEFPTFDTSSNFPIGEQLSLFGLWFLLFPENSLVASVLAFICRIVGLFIFYRFWKEKRENTALIISGTVLLTFWVSPHLMVYDAALLIIAAVVLWHRCPQGSQIWNKYFIVLWLALLFSSRLLAAQQQVLPGALQIATVAIMGVSLHFWLKGASCVDGD